MFEKDLEVPETLMHVVGKGNGVTWPVDVSSFDEMNYTNVKHIKDSNGSLFRLALFYVSLYLVKKRGDTNQFAITIHLRQIEWENMCYLEIIIAVTWIERISIVVFDKILSQPLLQFLLVEGTRDNTTVAVTGKAEAS
jgi:hypothetical protein